MWGEGVPKPKTHRGQPLGFPNETHAPICLSNRQVVERLAQGCSARRRARRRKAQAARKRSLGGWGVASQNVTVFEGKPERKATMVGVPVCFFQRDSYYGLSPAD